MLPSPVSFSSPRRGYIRYDTGLRRGKIDLLLSRSRATNLAVLLLAALAAVSLLANLNWYLFHDQRRSSLYVPPDSIPDGLLGTLSRSKNTQSLTHLIIVPGHAIWRGAHPNAGLSEEDWILEDYQKGGGRTEAFFRHIKQGAELALADEHAVLVFSGGQTKKTSTTTEAESYLRLAYEAGLLRDVPFPRVTTENFALDSYQNLLFSIARFHEFTARYPERITVVGYEMKRERFTDLHRVAIRWPRDKFEYIGFDPEGDGVVAAHDGERKNGYLPYTNDLYGCHTDLLAKRRTRNLFARFHPYYTSSPELGGLLDWCPGMGRGGRTVLYNGPLPWS